MFASLPNIHPLGQVVETNVARTVVRLLTKRDNNLLLLLLLCFTSVLAVSHFVDNVKHANRGEPVSYVNHRDNSMRYWVSETFR